MAGIYKVAVELIVYATYNYLGNSLGLGVSGVINHDLERFIPQEWVKGVCRNRRVKQVVYTY